MFRRRFLDDAVTKIEDKRRISGSKKNAPCFFLKFFAAGKKNFGIKISLNSRLDFTHRFFKRIMLIDRNGARTGFPRINAIEFPRLPRKANDGEAGKKLVDISDDEPRGI